MFWTWQFVSWSSTNLLHCYAVTSTNTHCDHCSAKVDVITLLPNYPTSGHHCRFKTPLHCQILNRQWHTGYDEGLTSLSVLKNRHWSAGNSVGFWLHPTVSSWTTLPVCSPNRQWWLLQECRFLAQASSVEQTYTVGSWLKPAVLSKPTLSVHGSNWQCWARQHCRFVDNRQWWLRQHCRFVANRQWWPIRILLFYNWF